ncbi:family 76 glycoside hydrolase [Cryphonectria parasitica EP155]|uniref:Mannan endo-1,6-alpha-mannosidase n=1 Tax=Cryphonectria parasitica (strain ATCC 38755 / EP155) TaxID=660469 RepID=A0A9P4Y672_CRYP1|nr:family 76 glycoside hydrolase [Cryphonectria parasitica EP155]KAF3766830.1 family 76 glycoside hydrolase [Cryphonectria parasitica EP155]
MNGGILNLVSAITKAGVFTQVASAAATDGTTEASTSVAAVAPASLDVTSTSSILGVAKTLAEGTMSYYPGTSEAYAALPTPYYWWECGAMMGAMLDYSHYTNDSTYDEVLTTALSAQVVAPQNDLMVPADYGSEGNDDQAFWTFTVLSAAERNFPQTANTSVPSWLQVAENAFNSMSARWNTSACGGGLLWQIFADNSNGLNYRNSVSNGGLFQISARLYRATGNQTYLDWANKVWEWSTAIQFIDANYYVYDGADSRDNCTVAKRDNVTFSYAAGIYLYGAAVLANATNGTDAATWTTHTQGLLKAAGSFFSPYDNATDIMYEHACEPYGLCDTDMKSFKGYLSRFMYSSALMVPSIESTVSTYLEASATAAGKACSGGDNSTTCGQKWYTGAFDGSVGLGQQMSALETVHGLLAKAAPAPYSMAEIQDVRLHGGQLGQQQQQRPERHCDVLACEH